MSKRKTRKPRKQLPADIKRVTFSLVVSPKTADLVREFADNGGISQARAGEYLLLLGMEYLSRAPSVPTHAELAAADFDVYRAEEGEADLM